MAAIICRSPALSLEAPTGSPKQTGMQPDASSQLLSAGKSAMAPRIRAGYAVFRHRRATTAAPQRLAWLEQSRNNPSDGLLNYDANGNRPGGAEHLATLAPISR
jgi:hypothetical protein